MDCCSTKYVCGYLHTNYKSTDTERIVRDTLKKGVLLLAVPHSQVLLYRTADANGHVSCVSSVPCISLQVVFHIAPLAVLLR